MKKLFCILALAILITGNAFAADIEFTYDNLSQHKFVVTATVTADASGNVEAKAIDRVVGMNLFDVPKIYSATDDVFTVTFVSGDGVPFISKTTAAAITGEYTIPADRHTMIDAPVVDVTGLTATESCTIVFVFWRE